MIGLKTSRKTVAESVDLINRVKVNIDDFKQKIKKDRDEVKKQVEDIKLLKQIFASLDGLLSDFSNIYVGDILAKEWDYLFPQIIQSLIDVDNFMSNQFPRVYGFNSARDLSAYIAFNKSIKRLKSMGSTQGITLEPGESSSESVTNTIERYI